MGLALFVLEFLALDSGNTGQKAGQCAMALLTG
jgi:hypothetical protein